MGASLENYNSLSPRRKPGPIFQWTAFMDPAFVGVTTEVRSSMFGRHSGHPSPLGMGSIAPFPCRRVGAPRRGAPTEPTAGDFSAWHGVRRSNSALSTVSPRFPRWTWGPSFIAGVLHLGTRGGRERGDRAERPSGLAAPL